MAVKPFSKEELNFLKFSAIVFDEFPKALRQTFITMWNKTTAVLPGYQAWDGSPAVRNMFLMTEGVRTVIPTNTSIDTWDCTALFNATIYAKTFPSPVSKLSLAKLYINGRMPKPNPFHLAVKSPRGNQDETLALAVDQLRLLRNTLCHSAERKMNKLSFDQYVNLAKDAFAALCVSTSVIDVIGNLPESSFPTKKVDELTECIQKELQASNQFLQEKVIDQLRTLNSKVGENQELIKYVISNKSENQTSLPKSRLPPIVPNFVGREAECETIITSLTSESTRLVNIYGSPGFGKTSTAISIGHRLHATVHYLQRTVSQCSQGGILNIVLRYFGLNY